MRQILSILFLFVFTVSNAQITVKPIEEQIEIDSPKKAIYYKDLNNTLDKYVGTWVFEDGTHYLKIKVEKRIKTKDFIFKNYYEDRLYVSYQYKLNGTELYNTMVNPYLHIFGNTIFTGITDEVVLSYGEPSITSCSRGKTGVLTLKYVGSGTLNYVDPNAELQWSRETSYGFSPFKCPDGTEKDNSAFLIPANLTLTRE